VLPDLEANGIALFAISYDSVEVLHGFADKHDIRFPLLSDEGSRVIRQLGLINEHVQEDHAVYGIKPNPRHVDLPYPGVFVLDENGIIVHKRFHESYRERDTGAALIAQTLGVVETASTSSVGAPGELVSVRAWLDSSTYSFFQRMHVNIEIRIAPGFSVYAGPTPAGMVPLSVHVAPLNGVEIGAAHWPAGNPTKVEGLDDAFSVHEGTVRGFLPLTFAAPPGGGDHTVELDVRYQACGPPGFLPPVSVRLSLPIREVALVDRTLPGESSKT